MKTAEDVLKEIKIREKIKGKFKTYTLYKTNNTVISTLKRIIGLPSNIKWYSDDEKYNETSCKK